MNMTLADATLRAHDVVRNQMLDLLTDGETPTDEDLDDANELVGLLFGTLNVQITAINDDGTLTATLYLPDSQ